MPRPAAPFATRSPDRTRRPFRAAVAWHELPAAYHAPEPDDAALGELLDRYAATGAESDRGALATHMLSTVASIASGRRARDRHASAELDELASDGAMAVLDVIDRHAHLSPAAFRRMAAGAVFASFAQRARERAWGGKTRGRNGRRLTAARNRLMGRLRRPPTAAELAEAFAAERAADGPGGCDADRHARVLLATDDGGDGGGTSRLDATADRSPTPDVTAADRETMALAMAGLTGDDREMFRLAVDGVPHKDIAARFGLSRQASYRRVNGLLWQARCRADLARHLGVEPAAYVPHYSDGGAKGITSVTPARLAI